MENNGESCPLCGTELSKVKFSEIQTRLKVEKQQILAEQAKRVNEAEVTIRFRLEQEFKRDLKIAEENAAELAKKKLDGQIKKIAAERDQANEKLKEAGAREVEIRQQAKAEAEKKSAKEVSDQRSVLEKDKAMALLKQRADFNREREAFQKKVKLMEHQLQKNTANELGEGGEVDVFESLREAFPRDRITRIKKGQPGADIVHEILHKGQACGQIIIDSKVRQGWQHGFVTKLRQDQIEAGAEQAILATSVFPSGKKEMCIESNIIIVNPARVVHIVHVLRQAMITMHIRGLSMKERAGKMNRLYKLITSESYRHKFGEAGKLTQDILELDVQEKKAHDNVWKKRGTVATRINNVLREIETDVAAVIEGDDDDSPEQAYALRGDTFAASGENRLRR